MSSSSDQNPPSPRAAEPPPAQPTGATGPGTKGDAIIISPEVGDGMAAPPEADGDMTAPGVPAGSARPVREVRVPESLVGGYGLGGHGPDEYGLGGHGLGGHGLGAAKSATTSTSSPAGHPGGDAPATATATTTTTATAEPGAHREEERASGEESDDDTEPYAAFRRFMASGWGAITDTVLPRDDCAPYTAKRRSLLGTRFPGETLVVPSGGLRVRANDTDYPFRPGSDFFWLTGCHEPDAVLVLTPNVAGEHDAVVYLADRSDRSSSAFYTDRRYGELWVGPRPGVRETSASLEVECRPLTELPEALARLAPARTRVLRDVDTRVDSSVLRWSPESGGTSAEDAANATSDRDTQLAQALSELRLVKDDFEVARLEEAVAATVRGFTECVGELDRAIALPNGERWLEGTFWRRARTDGNDVGYGSIVACGHHATTLHWVRDDGPVRPGDLALLDMGVEGHSLYTADVTRTLPVDGRFTDVQRQVYEVVARAQQAGIDAVRPGAAFADPHRAAMRVVAEALHDWGLLPVDVETSLSRDPKTPGAGMHRRYTLHSTSHMLGLDVHDCAQARDETYLDGSLDVGMVLTVEPGLYFQADDLTVPPELRGIGVRIEDDILVTATGNRNLSAALPRRAPEVEKWMSEVRVGKAWQPNG